MQRYSIPLHRFRTPAARQALLPTLLTVFLCILLSGASVPGQAENLVSPLTGLTLPEGAQKAEVKTAMAKARALRFIASQVSPPDRRIQRPCGARWNRSWRKPNLVCSVPFPI